MSAQCTQVLLSVLCIVGALMSLLGLIFLLVVFPEVFREKINENLVLKNGTAQADRFAASPGPTYMKFFIFNVTNINQVNNNGAKANLQELGPYVYREVKVKNISEWDEVNGLLRYTQQTTFIYEPSLSKGDLSDRINHVNVVNIALKRILEKKGFSFLIPFIRGPYVDTHSADELLFKGYNMNKYLPVLVPPALCQKINNCTFGFYYGQNGSISKPYEVSSGVRGMADYTDILRYAGNRSLNYWYGRTCNALNGTDGRQFHPEFSKDETPDVFSSDLCRSLRFQFETDSTIHKIPALRFVVPKSVFADANVDQNNMCFCKQDANKTCPFKSGVIDLQSCQDGNPIMASSPHFYQGDPEYWISYGGLSPDKEKHESFLHIEPLTGTVISAAKRLQISVDVEPDRRLTCLKFVQKRTFFPVLWVEEGGDIDSKSAEEFYNQVLGPYRHINNLLIAVSSIGIGTLFIAVIGFIFKWKNSRRVQYDQILNN